MVRYRSYDGVKVMRCRKSHPKTRRMGYSVCTVANEQVDFGDLIDDALGRTGFADGMGEGVVIQLTNAIRQHLFDGNSVEIRGLGRLRFQAKAPWKADPRELHKADVELSIRFEPCNEIRRFMRHPMVRWTGKMTFPEDEREDGSDNRNAGRLRENFDDDRYPLDLNDESF